MQYKLSKVFTERYEIFLKSDVFKDLDEHSKSEYWKYFASRVKVEVSDNNVKATGESGFYTSSSSNSLQELKRKILSVIESPSKITARIKSKLGLPSRGIKLLNYFVAFEKVMERDLISEPELSPFRINFDHLRNRNILISTVKKCKDNYFEIAKSNSFGDHVILSYYYLNILYSYVAINDWKEKKVILEIGAGNGNLMSILKNHIVSNTTFIDVDLPETISHSLLYIVSAYPEARVLMPNEAAAIKMNKINFSDYDFVFLTPNQTHLIDDNSVDLSINTDSFQEMTHKQINEYFKLIQRVGKDNSYFFTTNRVEKIPNTIGSFEKETAVLPNRFSNYPWNNSNEVIILEICRLTRLVQLDHKFIRLEKIKK